MATITKNIQNFFCSIVFLTRLFENIGKERDQLPMKFNLHVKFVVLNKSAELVYPENLIAVIKKHILIRLVITILTNNKVFKFYRRNSKIDPILSRKFTGFSHQLK